MYYSVERSVEGDSAKRALGLTEEVQNRTK